MSPNCGPAIPLSGSQKDVEMQTHDDNRYIVKFVMSIHVQYMR